MPHPRIVAASAALLLGALMGAAAGCGSADKGPAAAAPDLPGNVTVDSSPGPAPPHTPEELVQLAQRLAGIVDFHDEDFSGSWYDPATGYLYIGTATDAGRRLLEKAGLTTEPALRVVSADRSLAAGQAMVSDYAEHSAFGDRLVTYGALPEGDGFSLSVTGTELTPEQLADLGRLPVRVVLTTGDGGGGFTD